MAKRTKRSDEIEQLTERIRKFRDTRDWMKFHNHKDMAISLVLEANEVLEHFQWKSPEEIAERAKTHKKELSKELADVAIYLLELADNLKIDLSGAIRAKLRENASKYPIKKAKGTNKKYTEL